MKEVLKDLMVGVFIVFIVVAAFSLMGWLLVVTPAWLTGSLCLIVLCYCFGVLARLSKASK